MSDSPLIYAMARTLVDRSVNLTDDRAVIMCLVHACYAMTDISIVLDAAIARAHRMRDAKEVLDLDDKLRAVAAGIGDQHVP